MDRENKVISMPPRIGMGGLSDEARRELRERGEAAAKACRAFGMTAANAARNLQQNAWLIRQAMGSVSDFEQRMESRRQPGQGGKTIREIWGARRQGTTDNRRRRKLLGAFDPDNLPGKRKRF